MLSIACTMCIAATHNITHSPCKSHALPALPTTLPSTTLCSQVTKLQSYLCKRGKMAQDEGMVWKCCFCHSHLVWLVFEVSIPTYIHLFSFRNLFCDFFILWLPGFHITKPSVFSNVLLYFLFSVFTPTIWKHMCMYPCKNHMTIF